MVLFAQIDALATWLVNPWLFVGGLAAIALPILIHLLNKRRFRIVEWAAMRFLLAAQRKNSRRMRIEQLILLIVRCLVVFLVVLAMASVTGWAEEFWAAAAEYGPSFRQLVRQLRPEQVDETVAEILANVRRFGDGARVDFPAVIVVASGVR